MERDVKKVMLVERVTIIRVPSKPTLPTTHPKRRYIITPKMVKIEGVKTPLKVPKPEAFSGVELGGVSLPDS
jgi:hypothetical protein